MIQFNNEGLIEIEYQLTRAIADYENLKPTIRLKTTPEDAEKALEFCRELLKAEYKKIKGKKS